MLEASLSDIIQGLIEKAAALFHEYAGAVNSAQDLIVEHFGRNGLIAGYIILGALAVYLIARLAKITLATVKYLVVPAIALAFVGSLVLPYSFFILLPVTATACSLLLLFKG